MKDSLHQPEVISSPESPQEVEPAISNAMKRLLEKILGTREGRSLIAETIPIVLQSWAGNSPWRKIMSKMAAGTLKKGFGETSPKDQKTIEAIFQDPVFIDSVAESITGLFNSIENILAMGVQTLESMPLDDKKKITASLIARLINGTSGDTLTRSLRMIRELSQNDPDFFTQAVAPGFEKWVTSVDFGEIKEAVDGSAPSVVSLVQMANDVLWQYPAKVILLLSLLPSLANIVGSSAQVSSEKLKEIPPDLLSDILLSMIREIDGSMIAGLVNSFAEMGRKLHTGSALLGETGAPQLPKLFSEKMAEIIEDTDPVILWKSKIAMAEIKASFDHALAEAVHQNAEHLDLAMMRSPEVGNIRRQAMNRKLMMLASMDDEVFVDLMTQRLRAYDVQEAAEVLNNVLRLINRLGDQNPEALAAIVSRFTSAIDDYELSETTHRLISDANGSLKPAARSVVPGLVTWVCQVLDKKDDEYEADAMRAREALHALLLPESVTSRRLP